MSAFDVIDASQCYLDMLQYLTVFFILPLLTHNVIKKEIDLEQAISVYFAALFISFFYDIGILAGIFPRTYPTYRLGGTFGNPNDLAKNIGISAIGAFVLLTCSPINMYKRTFLFVYFCVAISLIAATGSFGGSIFVVVTLIAYVLFFLFHLSRKLRPTMMIKFILSLSIVSISVAVSLKHYYRDHISIYNFYLMVATEGGIVALIGLLTFFVLLFCAGSHLPIVELKAFFYFTLIAFLLNAMSSPNLYSRYHWFPIFFVFAGINNHFQSLSSRNYLRGILSLR